MKKLLLVTLVIMLALSTIIVAGSAPRMASAKGVQILEFGTMVGVPQALTGSQNPIRGINGGGLPWMLSSAAGELKSDGHLELVVRGLVLAAGANAGSNPVASFRAVVSCLTDTGAVQNVQTDAFPATTGPASSGGGNAKVAATLSLPQPCIAPIIFVTSAGGAWFAATGK